MSSGIDKLIKDYGKEEVDKLFTEYFLRIIAGNKMFEKIKFMVENGNTFDEIKDFIQGGITNDEGENFYT